LQGFISTSIDNLIFLLLGTLISRMLITFSAIGWKTLLSANYPPL